MFDEAGWFVMKKGISRDNNSFCIVDPLGYTKAFILVTEQHTATSPWLVIDQKTRSLDIALMVH